MTEPLILTTLAAKRLEIERQIASLETRLTDARADLLHILATVRIFDPKAVNDKPAAAYQSITKALPRRKLFDMCKAALQASEAPLCTRELTRHVIRSEAWDTDDRRLRLAVAHRVGGMMARLALRGAVVKVGERDKASLWRLG